MLSRRAFCLSSLAAHLRLRAQNESLPWLQDVRPDRATLVWCGPPDPALSAAATSLPDGRTLWKASLPNLAPAALNRYEFAGAARQFLTPSADPQPLRFLAFGDSGTLSEEQLTLAQWMETENPHLILHTGDLCYPTATDAALEQVYFHPYRHIMARAPFYPCPGNHDYVDDLAPYLRWHSFPPNPSGGRYYSFQASGAEFFSLDSNDPLRGGGAMLAWLDQALTRSRAFWRIAFFHHPPYTNGRHAGDPLVQLAAERLAPRLEKARLPLILTGHEHNYQRLLSQNTTYIVTGGGGAGLYEPAPHPKQQSAGLWHHYVRALIDTWRLTLEAIGLNGEILDRCELSPAPRLDSAVDAAAYRPRLAPGGLASLFGTHLSAQTSGITIELDGVRLPVTGATGNQVNVLLPTRAPGRAPLKITTPNGTSSLDVELLPSAPALFRETGGRPLTSPLPNGRVRLYLTGANRQPVRLRTSTLDLGAYTPSPLPELPGVEIVEIPSPAAWESLEIEPAR